jgi:hypothetical protein
MIRTLDDRVILYVPEEWYGIRVRKYKNCVLWNLDMGTICIYLIIYHDVNYPKYEVSGYRPNGETIRTTTHDPGDVYIFMHRVMELLCTYCTDPLV